MSAETDSSRRLKAIMFTDIKGYSSMMGANEDLAVKLVLEHRQIVRECLLRHEGSEHETIGHAFVVLFDSVVNAVRCAADIQHHLALRNAALPVAEQVWLRIGVHLGDIIVQGDGIYGDGVNVAARVQDKADPGGISITEQVYLQIDGKVDYPMEAMGKVDLKNIRNPPSLYKLHLDGKPLVRKIAWKRPLAVALALLAGAAVVWFVAVGSTKGTDGPADTAKAGNVKAENVAPAPAVAVPVAGAPAELVDGRKAAAGRKIAEAMAVDGPARLELLRQALALDPDNASVQTMLAAVVAGARAPASPAGAATVTVGPASAPASPPQAAPPQGAPAGAAPPAAKAVHGKGKAAGQGDEGETRIKRAIVVE